MILNKCVIFFFFLTIVTESYCLYKGYFLLVIEIRIIMRKQMIIIE